MRYHRFILHTFRFVYHRKEPFQIPQMLFDSQGAAISYLRLFRYCTIENDLLKSHKFCSIAHAHTSDSPICLPSEWTFSNPTGLVQSMSKPFVLVFAKPNSPNCIISSWSQIPYLTSRIIHSQTPHSIAENLQSQFSGFLTVLIKYPKHPIIDSFTCAFWMEFNRLMSKRPAYPLHRSTPNTPHHT